MPRRKADVPPLTPKQRSTRARIGARHLHATHDSKLLTEAAREKFLGRFVDEVDPDRLLPEQERLRRAEHAKRAYFAKLALRSARARSARAQSKRSTIVAPSIDVVDAELDSAL
jgi:hypothetical protein